MAPVENYTEYLPDGVNLALVVQKVGGPQPVIDYHSQQMALTASTMKLLTALAALLQLSPDYRFTTTLEAASAPVGGVLRGNLTARFGGDPMFTRQRLRKASMVAELRKQGIKQITGNLIIDTSVLPVVTKPPAGPGTI